MPSLAYKSVDELAGALPGGDRDRESKGRILLVDDVFDNRIVLSRRLLRRGYEVIEADCGQAALALIAREAFDLVLLDVMMPDLSGLEVLTEIRRTLSSQQLPVIMVTAKTFSHDVVEALQMGADDYVTKPVDFDVALARIVTQIAKKRATEGLRRDLQAGSIALLETRNLLSQEHEELQRSTSTARYLATHDALTGMLNRAEFLQAASQAAKDHADGGSPYAVLFLDLDRFKTINDTFGHAIGDKLLREIADRISSTVSPRDAVSRFGGDEFVILHICDAASETAIGLADRLIEKITGSFVIGDHHLAVGVSIGIASPCTINEPAEQTIAHADIAMYRAKREGGDRARAFDLEMAETARRRLELEHDLRFALKRGQLNILYQPIVQLSDHTISGFEALLRWNHPKRGTVSPSEFIPIAEETGLIIQIGEWVLRQACTTAMTWPIDIKVAVNLSAIQFQRGQLLATVMSALATSGLAPNRLELEITETLLLTDPERTIAMFRQLREIGVQIAMDDFGTGYSSLGYLKEFEFDKIKIDQSFVRSLETDASSKAIVKSISQLARTLGIMTTAEGVETEDQLQLVRSKGIGQVQGFFFGRPIRPDQIEETISILSHRAG